MIKKLEKSIFYLLPQNSVSFLRANLKKNGGFAIFLTATPSVLLRNSDLGLKVTQT